MITEEEMNQRIALAEQQKQANDVNQDFQAMQLTEGSLNLADKQLNLDEEIKRIENLLRGKVQVTDKFGKVNWVEPADPNLIVLTEYGVYVIMNAIQFYLNKNLLLSNYQEEMIDNKMEDFATSLVDDVFMEYELIFKYPTFEECKLVLEKRLEKRVMMRKFAYEIVGKKVVEGEIKEMFMKEIEGRIENEMEKIREQIMKNKLKKFDLLMRCIQDTVHNTYLRALWGLERKTLRQFIHVSENTGVSPNHSETKLNPVNWFKRK